MDKTYILEEGGLDALIIDIERYKKQLIEANIQLADDLVETGRLYVQSNAYSAPEPEQVVALLIETEVSKQGTSLTQKRVLSNNSTKATFAEFGYGIVGKESPYQYDDFIDRARSNYLEYDVDSPAKKTDVMGRRFWFYRDMLGELKKSYGEQPTNLFYFAGQIIKTSVENIARIRFGNLWR